MCIAVPVKILEIKNDTAIGDLNGTQITVRIALIDHLVPGDYVLVHTGYAIEKLDSGEAEETIGMLDKLKPD